MNKKAMKRANDLFDTEEGRLIAQTEFMRQLLEYCSIRPGATIKIVVSHVDGQTATLDTYDHAALVGGLYTVLGDYQDEI